MRIAFEGITLIEEQVILKGYILDVCLDCLLVALA
jgi:hypothetical protein